MVLLLLVVYVIYICRKLFLKSFGQKLFIIYVPLYFKRFFISPHDEFYKLPIGNWVTRITNDVESLRTLYMTLKKRH